MRHTSGLARAEVSAVPARARRILGRAAQFDRVDILNVAIIGVIFTYVWRLQDLYPILATIKFSILALLLAIGAYLLDRTPMRSLRGINHPVTTTLCVILALAVLSVPTSIYRGLSFNFITDDLGKNFLLFVILAASVRAFADVGRYAAAIVFGGAVYAWYVYTKIAIGQSGRLGNIVYYDANDLGMLLVASLPLALFFIVRGKRAITRILATAAVLLFMLVIIKTGSRGAFLGLIAVGLYVLIFFRAVKPKVRIAAVVAGASLMMIKGGDNYWSLMRTMLNPKSDYNWSGNSEEGRMEVWKRGVGYMFTHPITGIGVATFPVAEGTISDMADRQQFGFGVKWSAAHNSFVQIGAELGVIGLISFVAVLFHGYRSARARIFERTPERPSDEEVMGIALAGSLVGFVVSGFWLSQAYGAFNFTLFGIIVGLAKLRSRSAGRPAVVARRRSGATRGRGRADVRRNEHASWSSVS